MAGDAFHRWNRAFLPARRLGAQHGKTTSHFLRLRSHGHGGKEGGSVLITACVISMGLYNCRRRGVSVVFTIMPCGVFPYIFLSSLHLPSPTVITAPCSRFTSPWSHPPRLLRTRPPRRRRPPTARMKTRCSVASAPSRLRSSSSSSQRTVTPLACMENGPGVPMSPSKKKETTSATMRTASLLDIPSESAGHEMNLWRCYAYSVILAAFGSGLRFIQFGLVRFILFSFSATSMIRVVGEDW